MNSPTVNIEPFVKAPATELRKLNGYHDAIKELQDLVTELEGMVGQNPNGNFITAVVFINGVNRQINIGYDGNEPVVIP